MATREKPPASEALYPKAYFDRAWESLRQKREPLGIDPSRHNDFVNFLNGVYQEEIKRPPWGWLPAFEPESLTTDEKSYFATLAQVREELDKGVDRGELTPGQRGKLMKKFGFTEPKEKDF